MRVTLKQNETGAVPIVAPCCESMFNLLFCEPEQPMRVGLTGGDGAPYRVRAFTRLRQGGGRSETAKDWKHCPFCGADIVCE